jgi:hypothetical protein
VSRPVSPLKSRGVAPPFYLGFSLFAFHFLAIISPPDGPPSRIHFSNSALLNINALPLVKAGNSNRLTLETIDLVLRPVIIAAYNFDLRTY